MSSIVVSFESKLMTFVEAIGKGDLASSPPMLGRTLLATLAIVAVPPTAMLDPWSLAASKPP